MCAANVTREQIVQRLEKTLEQANIKLDSVITDIMGLSGRGMIEVMIKGVRNPWKLAELADRRHHREPQAPVRCAAWSV